MRPCATPCGHPCASESFGRESQCRKRDLLLHAKSNDNSLVLVTGSLARLQQQASALHITDCSAIWQAFEKRLRVSRCFFQYVAARGCNNDGDGGVQYGNGQGNVDELHCECIILMKPMRSFLKGIGARCIDSNASGRPAPPLADERASSAVLDEGTRRDAQGLGVWDCCVITL